jgi:hypothetical protein
MSVEVLPVSGPRSTEARAFLELLYLYRSCPQGYPLRARCASYWSAGTVLRAFPGSFFSTRRELTAGTVCTWHTSTAAP